MKAYNKIISYVKPKKREEKVQGYVVDVHLDRLTRQSCLAPQRTSNLDLIIYFVNRTFWVLDNDG